MNLIKNVMYAGIGLAEETKGKVSGQFGDWVEKGKKFDQDNHNLVKNYLQSFEDLKLKTEDRYNQTVTELETFIHTLKTENGERETNKEPEVTVESN